MGCSELSCQGPFSEGALCFLPPRPVPVVSVAPTFQWPWHTLEASGWHKSFRHSGVSSCRVLHLLLSLRGWCPLVLSAGLKLSLCSASDVCVGSGGPRDDSGLGLTLRGWGLIEESRQHHLTGGKARGALGENLGGQEAPRTCHQLWGTAFPRNPRQDLPQHMLI